MKSSGQKNPLQPEQKGYERRVRSEKETKTTEEKGSK